LGSSISEPVQDTSACVIDYLPKFSSLAGFYICLWLGIAIATGALSLWAEDLILMTDLCTSKMKFMQKDM